MMRGRSEPIDLIALAQGMRQRGLDPRTWVSYGLVSRSEDTPVVFDEDMGQPLVYVDLQPSGIPIVCRVSSSIAGNGEGEWHPFVAGDEVVVVIPEGIEDGGGVIIGRLNNKLDKFPMESVAGQDPTTNTFAMRRRRTPFVEEFAGPITWRSVVSGTDAAALIAIDGAGAVTLKDSENSVLQLSADVFGYQGPSDPEHPPEYVLQLALTQGQFILQVKDAYMQLSATGADGEVNILSVPGPMSLVNNGNVAIEHATTAEALVNLLLHVFDSLATVLAAIPAVPPLTAPALGLLLKEPTFATTVLVPAVTAAAGGTTPVGYPAVATILAAAFAAAAQKTNTGAFQTAPGLGCSGLFVG